MNEGRNNAAEKSTDMPKLEMLNKIYEDITHIQLKYKMHLYKPFKNAPAI
jgi:hypothetical protein